jgi:predicted PurR-regulated permease PerM
MPATGSEHTGTEWSQATKRTVAIAGVLIGFLILYISRPVLPAILLAAVIAFLLNPTVVLLHTRLRMSRWVAVLLTYVLLLIVLVLLGLVIVPAVVDSIFGLDIDLVDLLNRTTGWLEKSLASIRIVTFLNFRMDLSPLVDPALDMLTGVVPGAMVPSADQLLNSIPPALDLATGFASTVLSTVLWSVLALVFTLIYAIYFSLDWHKFGDAFLGLAPEAYRAEYSHLGSLIHRVWVAYFRGQLFLSLIVGVTVGVGTALLGLPGSLLLGILAGLLEVLPNIGPVLAAVPAVLLALLQGSSVLSVSNVVFALTVILFYLIVQQVENNVIVPRLIGHAVDVHPILIMAGVIVGASVGGILGAFMAAPIIATGRILSQYAYNKITGRSPFTPEVQPAAAETEVAPAATLPPVSISSTDGDGDAAAPQPAHTSDGETVEVAEVKDAPAPVESVEG